MTDNKPPFQVKLWTHQGNRIVWALCDTRKPRKQSAVKTAEHTSSVTPPSALVDEARSYNWHAWWDDVVAKANATPEGQVFTASNFTLEHTGGGCTAWERPVDNTGWRVLITDSEGLGHSLEGKHAYDPDREDCWLIGAHNDDGDSFRDECDEALTAEEALVAADNLHAAIRLREDGKGFGNRA